MVFLMQKGTNQLTKHLLLIYFESPCLLTDQGWTQASTFSSVRQALFWVNTEHPRRSCCFLQDGIDETFVCLMYFSKKKCPPKFPKSLSQPLAFLIDP